MRAAVIAAALALVACTETRPFPFVRVAAAAPTAVACADVRAQVGRTGKEGIGVVIALTGTGADACEISVDAVDLRIAGGVSARGEVPPTLKQLHLTPSTVVRGYVPISFDFNRAYNDGARDGVLVVAVGGRIVELPLVVEGAR